VGIRIGNLDYGYPLTALEASGCAGILWIRREPFDLVWRGRTTNAHLFVRTTHGMVACFGDKLTWTRTRIIRSNSKFLS
jgi:hypothetical protein